MRSISVRGLVAVIATAVCLSFGFAPDALAQRISAAATTTLDAPKLSSKGAWSATANYVLGDLVTSRGSTWRAKRANTGKVPGQTLPTSTAADWELLASGFNPRGAWLAGTTYHANDLVTRAGSTWRAKRTSAGVTPETSAQDWEQFAAAAMGAPGLGSGPAGSAGAPAFSLSDDDTAESSSRKQVRLPPVPKGTAGAPALRFKGDTNTGIFSPSAGKIALVEDGVLFLHNKGTENTALGLGALLNSTGSSNTAVGATALLNNTGFSNTAVGNAALHFNDNGQGNTAVGDLAMANNISGNNNTAIGKNVMRTNISGSQNVGVGREALFSNNDGHSNSALGYQALVLSTSGINNVAVGTSALGSNEVGGQNTAVGALALLVNTNHSNTAVGHNALLDNTSGGSNTAVGQGALSNNTIGDSNIAIGTSAGINPVGAVSNSIFIGNVGAGGATDTTTIKIGTQGTQTRTFIAGIRPRTTGVADAISVLIDSAGQLGTVSSSRRYKEDIATMGDMSAMLAKLRPVTFRYKQPFDDGSKPVQYGLIAEEVAEVLPGLAVFNEKGQPETVKYHLLPSFLLAGYQQQQKIIAAQAEKIDTLEQRLAALEAKLGRLAAR